MSARRTELDALGESKGRRVKDGDEQREMWQTQRPRREGSGKAESVENSEWQWARQIPCSPAPSSARIGWWRANLTSSLVSYYTEENSLGCTGPLVMPRCASFLLYQAYLCLLWHPFSLVPQFLLRKISVNTYLHSTLSYPHVLSYPTPICSLPIPPHNVLSFFIFPCPAPIQFPTSIPPYLSFRLQRTSPNTAYTNLLLLYVIFGVLSFGHPASFSLFSTPISM